MWNLMRFMSCTVTFATPDLSCLHVVESVFPPIRVAVTQNAEAVE